MKKVCKTCQLEKAFSEFHTSHRQKFGLSNSCKLCRSKIQADLYRKNWFRKVCILKKSWCNKNGVEFDLTPDYLEQIYTEVCPVFGVLFERHSKGSDNCPHLDRIDPNKGYTKGNVVYLSARANRIKYNCSVGDLRKVLKFLEGATTISQESTPKWVEAPSTEDVQ